jgi:hypothetical protein|tara:strand:+ start:1497 stop:1865 length:369 start_codon:yes stop_codon:yes gene_type:complete
MAKFKNPLKNLSIQGIVIFVAALLFVSQILSLFITSIFKDVPVLKTGNLVILLSVGITMIFLVRVAFDGAFTRNDIIGLVLIGGITVAAFVYLPEFFPQIFSVFGDSAIQSAQSLASTLNLP